MFNKNKRAIKGILNNIVGIIELLEVIRDALIQNKTRIDKLEKRVNHLTLLDYIVACSKCKQLILKSEAVETLIDSSGGVNVVSLECKKCSKKSKKSKKK